MGLYVCFVVEDKNILLQNDIEDFFFLMLVIVDMFFLEDNCVKFGVKILIC